ncbi:hypothetical protein ACOMHN_009137 [Nucella lapillus]
MSRSSSTPPSPARGSRGPRLLLALTLLALCCLPACQPMSLLGSLKHLHPRQNVRCPNEEVSAICYQCASMDATKFWEIHDPCCQSEGDIRQLCRAWYSEEPKRGRRDVWYY